LRKGWPRMDAEARSAALSELLLPALQNPSLSTPRLEELVWHRLMLGTSDVDVMSQVHLAEQSWPNDAAQAKIHASKLADIFLKTGLLI
jgi:ubiquinone biosynthesis protein COQ9